MCLAKESWFYSQKVVQQLKMEINADEVHVIILIYIYIYIYIYINIYNHLPYGISMPLTSSW
jgi:hypothetical protein